MAEYLYPGTYVEEQKFGTPPMTGGSSSTGAFVGFTPRGPLVPTLVTSWTDFVNKFAIGADSPYLANAYLSYQMYGFFNNGGQRAYVSRATDGTDVTAKIVVANGVAGNEITISAKDSGAWGNQLKVKLSANAEVPTKYDVTVLKGTTILESFKKLAVADFYIVNNDSKFITIVTNTVLPLIVASLATHTLATGTDGLTAVTPAHLATAMNKFDSIEQINLLVISESQAAAVVTDALAYCEKRKDCVFIADAGMNDTFASVQTFKSTLVGDFGTMYYPWVEIADPIGKVAKNKFVPNAGHVAGFIARNDNSRGVFKAPAGTEAVLYGVLGVKTRVSDQEQGILNPQGINVVRSFPGVGIVVWGARTMSGNYLNVRRELNYVMGALGRSTKWAVFEPNNADTWRKLRNQMVDFLESRYALGAYKGEGEGTAYFVKCDAELNTQVEIDNGRINSEIGIAINKPGEFVIFRVGQWDGGTSVA